MSYLPTAINKVLTNNSSIVPLNDGQTYTGTYTDVSTYGSIVLSVLTDQSGTIYLDFSPDSGNTDSTLSWSVVANVNEVHRVTITRQYARIRFTNNSGGNQTFFRLQTIVGEHEALTSSLVSSTLPSDWDATVTRSVLAGQYDGSGLIGNMSITHGGFMPVKIVSPTSAFGDIRTEIPTPHCQIDFVYGANTNLIITGATGSGSFSATTNDPTLTLSTGAATGSSMNVSSRRYMKYRPGQGGLCRVTGIFSDGVSGNTQLLGLGDQVNGYFFGYSGTTFGIIHRERSSDTFYPQSSWNIDTCDGSNSVSNKSGMLLNPQRGNVYEIRMTYLGYGNIAFSILNPNTARWFDVHAIIWPNNKTTTLVTNPSMNGMWETKNTTNNTNVPLIATCVALFSEGMEKMTGPKYAIDNNKNITAIATTNILTLSAATTYKGFVNKAQVRIKAISLSTDSNATNFASIATLQVIRNAALAGSPSYTPIGTDSMVTYDVAGTTVSGGITLYNLNVGKNANISMDVEALDIFMAPGETLTFAVKTIVTNAQQIGVAINWVEDL